MEPCAVCGGYGKGHPKVDTKVPGVAAQLPEDAQLIVVDGEAATYFRQAPSDPQKPTKMPRKKPSKPPEGEPQGGHGNQEAPVENRTTPAEPETGIRSRSESRPGELTGSGPIEAFNKLMTIFWLIDILQIFTGSGTPAQKAVAVGESVAIGTLTGSALETLVGSDLAGPIGFLLTLRSDNARFNREQEINELIDSQTHDLWDRIENWTDSHPPPAENPWHVHSKAEARQYIINKLVAEQEEKLNEAKKIAQEKADEEEAKRQDAMHPESPEAAEILGDALPL
jgi:hypothetical protein